MGVDIFNLVALVIVIVALLLGISALGNAKNLSIGTKRFGVVLLAALPISFAAMLFVGRFFSFVFFAVLISLWVWAVSAVGEVAASKGYGKGGFIIFAIFLPLIALIVVLALQPSQSKQTAAASASMVKCPACAELIQPEAIKCKHCGEMIGSTPATDEA